jgi:hypothetical protein
MEKANKSTNLIVLSAIALILLHSNTTPTAAAPAFDIWYSQDQYFGHLGNPQTRIDLLGSLFDPVAEVISLEYSLNAGPFYPLSIGPDTRRLYEPGDFCIEIPFTDLLDGDNYVLLRAANDQGSVTEDIIMVHYQTGNIWPENFTTSWKDAENIQDQIQIVNGLWELTEDGLRTVQLGYDRMVTLGDITWDDYEVTVPVTVHDYDPNGFNYPSNQPGFGIIIRWSGHTDDPINCGQPHCGWIPHGSSLWYDWDPNGGFGESIGGSIKYTGADPLDYNVCYNLKMRVETIPSQGNLYKVKVWQHQDPEPQNWHDSGYRTPEVSNGSVILLAHHVDVTIGDITINSINDTMPVIDNIKTFPRKTSAAVTWTTDKPTVGRIDYGKTQLYELGTVTESLMLTEHRINIKKLQTGTTYHFMITVTDNANNSSSSDDATFTTKTRKAKK